MLDLIIKRGTVIDTLSNIYSEKMDIGIKNKRITKVSRCISDEAANIIEAEGLYVMPGLIDCHTHIFQYGTQIGLCPELLFSTGVTAAVDAGSAGAGSFEIFEKTVLNTTKLTTRVFLNCASEGLTAMTARFENISPKYFNKERILELCSKYSNRIVGLKIRLTKDIVEQSGVNAIDVLKEAVKIGEEANLPLMVWVTNFPGDLQVLIDILRPGDIFSHVYHGQNNNIISNGRVSEVIKKGRKKGLLFEVAPGKADCVNKIIGCALKDEFPPDIISTDISAVTFLKKPLVSLPYLMSIFLAFGMPLYEVIDKCTRIPAKVIGLEGQIGTLSEDAMADVAIMELYNKDVSFYDAIGDLKSGKGILKPMATIKNGELVYSQIEF